jgi:hypothetical protein
MNRGTIVRLWWGDWVKLALLSALVTVAIVLNPSFSQIPSGTQSPGGQGPTGQTNINAAIPATSTLVTLTAPSSYVTIANYSTTTNLYWSAVSPATSSNFYVAPSTAYTYQGVPLSQVYILGSAASGNYGILSH